MYMHLHTYAFLGIRELLAGENGWFVFIICHCHCLRNNTRGEGQMAPRLRKAENRKGQNNLWAREHLNRQCPGTDGAEHAVLLGVCVSTHSFYLESPQANTWVVFIKKKNTISPVPSIHTTASGDAQDLLWAWGWMAARSKLQTRTSLVVQWLRFHLPMQAVQVQALAGELRSHMLSGQKTKT